MKRFSQLSALDYAAIHNLYAYYNLCSDSGDAQGYAACFTNDGVMDQVTRGLTIQGTQALIDYKKKDAAGRGGRYRRHWNSGLYLVEESARQVRGICYLHAFNGDPGRLPELQAVGSYEDTIVLVGDEWKFKLRRLTMAARIESPPPTGGSLDR